LRLAVLGSVRRGARRLILVDDHRGEVVRRVQRIDTQLLGGRPALAHVTHLAVLG
jgi:hypothetical protein